MATTTINFSTDNGRVVSNAIVPSGNQLVLQIKFEKRGACVLQRRISDDVEWIDYVTMTSDDFNSEVYLTTISGLTVGEQLRIRFSGGATPSTIKILQE